MSEHLPYVERGGNYYWQGDMTTAFPFDLESKADRRRAFAEMEKHAAKLTKQREAIAGRNLTERELINGVEHSDSRRMADQLAAKAWQPIAEESGGSKYDAYIDELQSAAEAEAVAKMSPTEKRLHAAKKARDQERAEAEREAERAARLNDPKIKPLLDKLRSLQERMRFDPSRERAEVELVEQTIAQLSSLGASVAAGEQMFRSVLQNEEQRRQNTIQSLQQQRQELDQQLNSLAAQAPPPEPETQSIEDYESPYADAIAQLDLILAQAKARKAEMQAAEAEAS